jgi:hypothetical protein
MKNLKNSNKYNDKTFAIAMIVIAGIILSNVFLYADEIKKLALNNAQEHNASALQGKTILTGPGLSNEAMTNIKNQEEARLLYILKREEMQKERLTNSRLRCL